MQLFMEQENQASLALPISHFRRWWGVEDEQAKARQQLWSSRSKRKAKEITKNHQESGELERLA